MPTSFCKYLLLVVVLLGSIVNNALAYTDPIKGYLSPRKAAMDVLHYALELTPNIPNKHLNGKVSIKFKIIAPVDSLVLDLYQHWQVDSIVHNERKTPFHRLKNEIIILAPQTNQLVIEITIYYQGQPLNSSRPPWTTGFVWETDSLNRPWIGVACEGGGASSWWPCKDHPSDKPDNGVTVSCNHPKELTFVSNGRQIAKKANKADPALMLTTYEVKSPINLYNVTLNLGHYSQFSDTYISEECKKILTLNYSVLDYNLEKAKTYFAKTKKMLSIFEKHFGPYPFYEDGFQLVETPYWGMEHQSCIAYGNKYKQNKYGFDFIIVHESGHEWWGNAVSASDHADLWVHEAFCTYAELIYVEQTLGSAKNYASEMRQKIKNMSVIVGPPNMAYNNWQDADMYYKGALMLNTIRRLLNNDNAWFKLLKEFAQQNRKPISTATAMAFFSSEINKLNQKNETRLSPETLTQIFRQYLFSKDIPVLELKQTSFEKYKEQWQARFTNVKKGFSLPITCLAPNDGAKTIQISSDWTNLGYYGAPQLEDLMVEIEYIKASK